MTILDPITGTFVTIDTSSGSRGIVTLTGVRRNQGRVELETYSANAMEVMPAHASKAALRASLYLAAVSRWHRR